MRALTRSMIGPVAGLIVMVLAATVVGCATPPTDQASLDQARAAVERARGAPRVRALAAAELDHAEAVLERAQAAAQAGKPASHVEHLAYAASREAALAEAHAAERVAQAEIEALLRALDQLSAPMPSDLQADRAVGQAPAAAVLDAPPELTRRTAGPALPAPLDVPAPDLTLSLSELAFEDALPGDEAATRLQAAADLLVEEPARKVSIVADSDPPDPAARTLMERRIETVRAAFVRRGIDAARISVRVRAPDNGRAASPFERLEP